MYMPVHQLLVVNIVAFPCPICSHTCIYKYIYIGYNHGALSCVVCLLLMTASATEMARDWRETTRDFLTRDPSAEVTGKFERLFAESVCVFVYVCVCTA